MLTVRMIIRSADGKVCCNWSAGLAAAPLAALPPLGAAGRAAWAGAGGASPCTAGAASLARPLSDRDEVGELEAAQALVESTAINPRMATILTLTRSPKRRINTIDAATHGRTPVCHSE
jgi:hypothetical protein